MLHCAYYAHFLPVAQRQFVYPATCIHLQSFEQHPGFLTAIQSSHVCCKLYHISHLHGRIKHGLRRHVTYILKYLFMFVSRIHSEHTDTAFIFQESQDRPYGSGFTCTVRTQESEYISLFHGERNILHSPVFSVMLSKIFYFKNFFSHATTPLSKILRVPPSFHQASDTFCRVFLDLYP